MIQLYAFMGFVRQWEQINIVWNFAIEILFFPPVHAFHEIASINVCERLFLKIRMSWGQKTKVNDKNLIQLNWTIEWRREVMLQHRRFSSDRYLQLFLISNQRQTTKNDKLKPKSRFSHFKCLYVLAIKKFFVQRRK